MKVNCGKFSRIVCDVTARVQSREWCATTGRPEQIYCPYGPDETALRLSCERERSQPIYWVHQGRVCDDENSICFPHPEPTKVFLAIDARGVIRACSPSGVCGTAVLP